MNVSSFLNHHHIRSNPFMDEEARRDEVFAHLRDNAFEHAELRKIMGDVRQTSSAVVFGEKGSGKTAIRLQVQEAIERFNAEHPDEKSLVIGYDDLNPVLDRFARHVKGRDPLETLRKLTLNDHIDGLLSVAVPDLVDAVLKWKSAGHVEAGSGAVSPIGPLDRATRRKFDKSTKRDWLLLQALYDRPEQAAQRGNTLRSALRYYAASWTTPMRWFSVILWVLAIAAFVWYALFDVPEPAWAVPAAGTLLALLAIGATFIAARDYFRLNRLAHQLSDQLRTIDRSPASYRKSLEALPRDIFVTTTLPIDDLDETRYEMLTRLRRAIRPFGFLNIVILLDRVDEPTLVRGDQERMRAVVWPLFNNKFLQQPGMAFKMMLPIELRYALYGQSKDFFQEARLDKQNLIERLEWSGVTLYDLSNRRIAACTEPGMQPVTLRDLFDESVSRDDIIAALDQMRQPRDAFKMIYKVIQQHCANTTEEDQAWQIPSHTLDAVMDRQKERLDALRSGLGPA